MGKRKAKQAELWVSTSEIPKAASHPFYAKVNEVLDDRKLDRRLEHLCRRFYKPVLGRPSMAPGVYFRLLLIGFLGDRFGTRNRLAGGGLFIVARVSGLEGDRADAGSFDDLADAAAVAGGNAQGGVPVVCEGAGRRRTDRGTNHRH